MFKKHNGSAAVKNQQLNKAKMVYMVIRTYQAFHAYTK